MPTPTMPTLRVETGVVTREAEPAPRRASRTADGGERGGGRGYGEEGQVDGEDAPLAGEAAGANHAPAGLHALAGDGQAEPQARAIGVALLEGAEQVVGTPGRKPAALVLHLDERPPRHAGRIRPQHD